MDALLDAWRARGADRTDPVRFHRIAALQRRAAARTGPARQALEARLATLVQADGHGPDGQGAASARPQADATDDDVQAGSLRRTGAPAIPKRGPDASALGALLEAMAADAPNAGGHDAFHLQRAAYPELPALEDFRQLWSALRTGNQVRRSLKPPTDDAGPLNSGRLVHRALTLMRGLSPEYLRQFLAYADTLSWLETLQDARVLTGAEPTPLASGKPRAKARPRKRKE
ncbi:DUF2894 domain-containing protein [Luteimonas sp. SJ-16]|uniref:DUF2894 domain-containing protein n=1 Tax=Luteimonas deserti TaxID=2752306 RepID=A0A7Z0QSX3_9GAMM|nr:DUF2894 domain-containing protein [Luteimonas deserti]